MPTLTPGPGILGELEHLAQSGPLVPKLEMLDVYATPDSTLAYRFMYPGLQTVATIEALSYHTTPDPPFLMNFYHNIIHRVPQLQKLCLHGFGQLSETQMGSLAVGVLALSNLRLLELDDVQGLPRILHTISKHSTLQRIHIASQAFSNGTRALPDFQWTVNPSDRQESILPALKNLIVTLPIAQGTVDMLTGIRRTHSLEELVMGDAIDAGSYGANRNLRALCEEVGHHQDLRQLQLQYVDVPSFNFVPFIPLLRCSKLECLTITTNGAVYVTDSELAKLASALPLLRIFVLCPEESYLSQSQLTSSSLASVVHLLANCPHLFAIEILVHAARQVPSVATVRQSQIPPRESLELTMIYSPIGEGKNEQIVDFMRSLHVRRPVKIKVARGYAKEPSEAAIQVGFVKRWHIVGCTLDGSVPRSWFYSSASAKEQERIAIARAVHRFAFMR